jgi:diguanylate cyclase (GGDEF) domain
LTLSTLILLTIALGAALTALAIARVQKAPGRNALVLAEISAVWWVATVVLRLNSPDLADKVFYSELAWFGIVATPLFWSLGVLDYAGIGRAAGIGPKLAIFAVSAFAGTAALTNGWHQWIYTGITNEMRPTFTHGWLFFTILGATYFAMAAASLLALSRLKRASRLHRRQLIGLLVATLAPLAANAAFNLADFRLFDDDPTPFAFSATLLAVFLILRRDKLLIAPPIARDVIFSVIPDPIVVLDGDGLVLELNPAAERLPGFGRDTVGTRLPPEHPLAAFTGEGALAEPGTALIRLEAVDRAFEVSRQPLAQWGREGGLMLVLRDVTRRETALKNLADARRDLELRLEENLRLQRELEYEAQHDHLTGLHNRRHASAVVPALLSAASTATPAALVIVDLDHFKQVNDRFGHDMGDRVLTLFATILKEDLSDGDMAFRHGGEEFLVVLPGHGRDEALARCAAWRRALAARRPAELSGFPLGFSAGIAVAPDAGTTLPACTKAADVALYRAKINGRSRDVVWGEHLDMKPDRPMPPTGRGWANRVA